MACTSAKWLHAGAGGQWLVQPVETDFFDFHPAFTHGLQAALLEGLAMTVAVQQCEGAMMGTRGEQGNKEAHDRIPGQGACDKPDSGR